MNSLPAADSYGHNTWLTTLLLIFFFSQLCFSFSFHVTNYWLFLLVETETKATPSLWPLWNIIMSCGFIHFFVHILIHSVISVSHFNHSVASNSLQLHGLQNGRPPCPLATVGVYSNLCPLSRWCHPTISSSVVSLSSCTQSFPASGSFQMCQFFASGGQTIGVSASASVPPWTLRTDLL